MGKIRWIWWPADESDRAEVFDEHDGRRQWAHAGEDGEWERVVIIPIEEE
jgi:hypothetical protein